MMGGPALLYFCGLVWLLEAACGKAQDPEPGAFASAFQTHVLSPFNNSVIDASEDLDVSVGLTFASTEHYKQFPRGCSECGICLTELKVCARFFLPGTKIYPNSWKPTARMRLDKGSLAQICARESTCKLTFTVRNEQHALLSVAKPIHLGYFTGHGGEGQGATPLEFVEGGVSQNVVLGVSSNVVVKKSSTYDKVQLKFEFPQNGTVISTSKLLLAMELLVEDIPTFNKEHPTDVVTCYSLKKVRDPLYVESRHFCRDMGEASIKLSGLGDGDYELTAWLVHNRTSEIVLVSRSVTAAFSVMCRCGNGANEWYTDGPAPPWVPYSERYKDLPTGHTAIAWHESDCQLLIRPWRLLPPVVSNYWHREKRSVVLVIGVKVSWKGFAYRKVLRETWFKRETKTYTKRDVAMWFVVGRPPLDAPVEDLNRLIDEAKQHKDMLLGPHLHLAAADIPFPWVMFNVTDSYYTLVEKTVTFMTFATKTYDFEYLFMCDDDIFLRVESLLKALKGQDQKFRFFAGQVWEKHYGRPLRPIRDPESKNYVSWQHWREETLPPIAIGPHYLMSFDCVEFIVSNRHDLRGVGTLEDVSIAVWLNTIGVEPENVKWFLNAKNFDCQNGLVSFADLQPDSIRLLYGNHISGRALCDGYTDKEKKYRTKVD